MANKMDSPCSELGIVKIADKIENWKELAPYLGISPSQQKVICNNDPQDYVLQKRAMLQKWKQRLGNKATYRKLKECFSSADRQDLADGVDEFLRNCSSQSPHESSAEPSDQNLSELLSVVESLKQQSISLKFRLVKIILTGTPRVGKSTLKKRIMKEITNLSNHPEVNPSTGLEKPCVVQVLLDDEAERAAFIILHTSQESSRAWKNQDLHEQLSILFDSMLNENAESLGAKMDEKFVSPQASNPPVEINPMSPPVSSSLATDVGTIVQAINWKKTKEQLLLIQETTIVYIMDTGGQPEFHEVLPFVLQGPALHLVFFSLSEGINCLDRQFEVEYVSEKGTSIDSYKSVYPVKEVLFQLLASFHSLHKSETYSQHLANTYLNLSLDTPQAILIGTYKDIFMKGKSVSQQKQCLNEINQKLIATFEGSEFYETSFLSTVHPGLQCAETSSIDGDRFFVAMDNVYGTREEMDLFRQFLTRKISEAAHPIELPCSVLLFHLLLRYKYEAKPGICTIEECKELAEKCQIARADVTKVLKYLHFTLGTILYYEDVPSLKNTVFCDPSVLLSHINQLIAVCFTCDPTMKVMVNKTRETGIIEPMLWKYVCTKYQGPISKEQVIDFLIHYKLMVKIESEEGEKDWFMPCLLLPNPKVATITTDFLECVPICPLLIGFNGGVVPLGQFSSLIVRLCLKQWNNEEPWELAYTKRYRNQVTFLTDTLLCVRLTARPQFIEVLVEESSTATKEELQVFCFKARQHVMEAIKETQSGHKFDYGFYCPGSLSPGQTPHYAKVRNVKVMRCSREKKCGRSSCPVPPQGYMWLQETEISPMSQKSIENLQEVTVAGEKLFTFKGSAAQDLVWEQYGFRVHICTNAFLSDQFHTLTVKALVAGKFKFPPDCVLVSAVYAVGLSDKLQNPIEVKLQHCVDIQTQKQSQRLRFLRADLNQPYTFEDLNNGMFDVGSAYGSVSCQNFSLLAIVYDMYEYTSQILRTIFSPLSVDSKIRYNAKLVYCIEAGKWKFTFVFSKKLAVLDQYIATKLKGTKEWSKLIFSFEKEYVTLELEKKEVVDGWELRPRQYPCKLHWRDVAELGNSDSLPYFKMDVFPERNAKDSLDYEVLLTGTVEDNLSFLINLNKTEAFVTQALPALDSATGAPTLSSVTHSPPALAIEQLNDVKQELGDNFTEWKKLGLKLGLAAGKIEVIEKNCKGVEECLVEVLKHWLRRNYNEDKYGSPTWDCLVNALDQIDHALADRIRKKQGIKVKQH